MTAIAALVAEALAAGERRCEAHISNYAGSPFVPQVMHSHGIRYRRDDVVDAALAHLAARAVGAFDAGKAAQGTALSAETQALLADAYDANDKLRAQLKAAEERAGRAEARADKLRKSLDDVMYAICENALRGEGESAGAVCKRAIEDAAKEAARE